LPSMMIAMCVGGAAAGNPDTGIET